MAIANGGISVLFGKVDVIESVDDVVGLFFADKILSSKILSRIMNKTSC